MDLRHSCTINQKQWKDTEPTLHKNSNINFKKAKGIGVKLGPKSDPLN